VEQYAWQDFGRSKPDLCGSDSDFGAMFGHS